MFRPIIRSNLLLECGMPKNPEDSVGHSPPLISNPILHDAHSAAANLRHCLESLHKLYELLNLPRKMAKARKNLRQLDRLETVMEEL
jgi:hypothetical protein